MPNLKILKNKRAVNPIIIVILLIIALAVTGGILLLWQSLENRAGHIIEIQNVNFQETQTTVYVQNTGKGAVTLDSIFMNSNKFILSEQNCKVGSQATTTLQESQTATITLNHSYQEEVTIRVVCTDGTSNKVTEKPPL